MAIGLGIAVPLLRTAWLGAVGMTGAYIAGLGVVHPPPLPANVADLPRLVPPVLAIACLGYGILGTVAVLVKRTVSRGDAMDSRSSGV